LLDLVIVGAGPAGITASVYAARKRMDFVIVTKDVGGQAMLTADIENYTGYQFITGSELAQKFREHMEQFDVKVNEMETATLLRGDGAGLLLETDKAEYRSKTAIIASGRTPRKLGVEGEDQYRNRGVTYCATCDAPLFADMDVAVVGGGNGALDAVLQLIKIAHRVYLIDRAPQVRADPIMVEKARNSENVVFYNEATLKRIYGQDFVKGIEVVRGDSVEDLPVGGVFIEIGSLPVSEFVTDASKNEMGEIIVNCTCETSIPGVFAAGDVTNVYAKQIVVACGEGAKAALAAFDYLSRKR
jgi:alkyl hydroperoxide reductase subunit F